MNPAWGHVAGVVTLILLATFVGIWIWAWRKRHRATFDALSRLPMQDAESERGGAENDHGDADKGGQR